MLLRIDSHLHAETILESDYRERWEDLRDVLGSVVPALRPAGPFATGRGAAPKRQRRTVQGRKAYAMYPIDQVGLNNQIDIQLRSRGWQRQPLVVPRNPTGTRSTSLKGDFQEDRVFVEVEFGNQASLFRDLFKFQIAGRSGVGEVGVLVTATAAVASFFDQGVATYEQAVGLLPYMNIGLQLPTVIVGLDLNDWRAIERRYEEMRAIAEANGLSCHPFAAVRRAAPLPLATA